MPFLRIDLNAKRVATGDAAERTAPIHELTRMDGRLIMHGGQEGRSWSGVIHGESGRLTAAWWTTRGAS